MQLEYTHNQAESIALPKMQSFLTQLKNKYGDKVNVMEENWQGNTLLFKLKVKTGIPFVEPQVSGSLKVSDNVLMAEMPLPSFASGFEAEIRSKFQEVLDECFQNPS